MSEGSTNAPKTSDKQGNDDAPRSYRLGGIIICLAGAGLVMLALVPNLFSRAQSLESLLDALRPAMSDESIELLYSDIDGLDAAAAELSTSLPPVVAQAQGISEAEANQLLAAQFPDTVTGLQDVPGIAAQFRGLVGILEAEQERFEAADNIPMSSLPAPVVAWGVLLAGIVVFAAGIGTLKGRSATPALVAGAAIIVGGMSLSLPSKTFDADLLKDNVAPVFEPAIAASGNSALETVGAMGAELQTKALPALGGMLGIPADALNESIAAQFPASSAALGNLPASSARLGGLVLTIENNADNYDDLRSIDLSTIVNLLLLGGAATLVGAIYAILGARRES